MTEKVREAIEIAMKYIKSNYSPIGDEREKRYISSDDIVWELRDITTATTMEITALMDKAGYKVEFLNNKYPYWVVYVK